MNDALENKLAHLVAYLDDLRLKGRTPDLMGLSRQLDDPQVAEWLGNMRRDGRAYKGAIASFAGHSK